MTHGLAIRLAILGTHYRKPLSWNDKLLEDAEKGYAKLVKALAIHWPLGEGFIKDSDLIEDKEIMEAMLDDMNTAKAVGRMYQLAALAKKGDKEAAGRLAFGMNLLGFF